MDISSISNSIVQSQTAPAQDTPVENEEVLSPSDVPQDQMGSRLAILAKKEKAIRESQSSYAEKLKDIEAREAALSKYKGFDDVNDENAVDFLKTKGLSLEKLQERWLSTLSDEDMDPIQKQISELTRKLASKDDEVKKLLEETLSKRDMESKDREIEEQSVHYNKACKEFITENAEKYDLITTFDAAEEVFKVIKDVYLKTAEIGPPKLLKFDEAADLYEGKLADMVKGMQKSRKVRELLGQEENEGNDLAQLLGQNTIDSSFRQSSAHSPELKTQAERDRQAAKLFESMIGGIS